ncbi:hypothetical protein [Bradyrhizobium cenepequi]|uniref:hypothetical protein n=1 Tax=Bradyrhizobium cenepequi TaxID=2821403 RepID=UPI001CE2C5C2|nr:hypothetical protein [Bradyrhizobium cenepequi]MCA6108125.1 hypothetical protein [Bradyrhizobium cenepequi]
MSAEQDIAGPIIVWTDNGCEGWAPRSFASLLDAIKAGAVGPGSVVTLHVDVATHVSEPIEPFPPVPGY